MISTLKFCERNNELKTLIDRWRLASRVEDPIPQIVLIKGGQGFGKTRLALEFYRWLREAKDKSGYWADATELVGYQLRIIS